MYDCISFGSATQDVFVFTESAQIHRLQNIDGEQAFLALEYGAKLMVEQLFFTAGGGAVNNSIGLARQGLRCGIVCEVGDDDPATALRRALEKDHVDTSMMVHNESIHTGYSVIITGFDGDRTVLVHRGAARDLSVPEVNWDRVRDTQWIHLGSLAGESARLWFDVASFAADHGIRLAINPGSDQFALGLEGLIPVLQQTDIIFANKREAYRLAGVEDHRGEEDEREAMRRLHDVGCQTVVMTMGKQGAQAYNGRQYYFVPSREVPVVSNLGAGDAFASGCLGAVIRGFDLEKCLRAGALNAEGVVQAMGATEGLQTWEQMESCLDAFPNCTVQEA